MERRGDDRVCGAKRFSGEDPWISDRVGRDRSAADGMRRGTRSGGVGAGRWGGRPEAGGVRGARSEPGTPDRATAANEKQWRASESISIRAAEWDDYRIPEQERDGLFVPGDL